MMLLRRLRFALLMAAAVTSAIAAERPLSYEVRSVGEMRRVMRDGDLSATIDLKELSGLEHLYAIGPIEGLKGEITIWDSAPSVARVVDGAIRTSDGYDVKACFLVYAQVPSWREVPIPAEVQDADQLEAFVAKAARDLKIDMTKAFPFAVRGKVAKVNFHIMNRTGDGPFTREEHDKAKIYFSAADAEARVVGFYSEQHHGVFTHHGTNIHIHVIMKDEAQSGHIETLHLAPGSILLLPES